MSFGIAAGKESTVFIAGVDWCPQVCQGDSGSGYLVDIVQDVFKETPYKVEITIYPWSRAIHMVRIGKMHALLAPARQEAPDLVYPIYPVGVQQVCFFTTSESDWVFQGKQSLKGLQIGIPADLSVEELNAYIDMNPNQFQTIAYTKNYIETSLSKLTKHRFDTFLMTRNALIYHLRKKGDIRNYKIAGCVSKVPIYLAFTPEPGKQKEVNQMKAWFDGKMMKLIGSEKIPQIMKRYDLPDWRPLLISP